MGIECFRMRGRLWACCAGLLLIAGGLARATDANPDADRSKRTGVAARSTASTAASGRAPLASRILAGARSPVAPEPRAERPDAEQSDAQQSEEAGPPATFKRGIQESSPSHQPESAVGRAAARGGGEVSRPVSERVESAPPKRPEAARLASRNPVEQSTDSSGEATSAGRARQGLAILSAETSNGPAQAALSEPSRSSRAAPGASGVAAGDGRDRRQAATDEPRRSDPPSASSARSATDPQPGGPPPPVAKPSKNRWGLLRWFNPEWIRPAEPLPMVPTPWSYGGRGREGSQQPDAAESGPVAQDELSKAPRTQIALPRLSLDVRESVLEAAEGDPVSFRILLVNTGNRPAHDVDATIYFAEGIEPEAFSGAGGTISSGEVRFETIEKIDPGQKLELSVRGRTGSPGIVVYRAEAIARETPGTLAREGAVTVIGRLFGPDEQESE